MFLPLYAQPFCPLALLPSVNIREAAMIYQALSQHRAPAQKPEAILLSKRKGKQMSFVAKMKPQGRSQVRIHSFTTVHCARPWLVW